MTKVGYSILSVAFLAYVMSRKYSERICLSWILELLCFKKLPKNLNDTLLIE
jgi:hypothetical protein